MEEYLWLFAVVGGAFLLGAALIYGVLRQRPLSPDEQDRQNQKVRSLYGEGHAYQAAPSDGADRRRSRIGPLVLALVFIAVGCALGYYVATQSTIPSPSVEGKEEQNTQPAGPADAGALPGQQ